MSKAYTIKRFAMMKVAELSPHPEALIPIDDEDAGAIADSVATLGAVMDPLLVVMHGNAAAQVVDGCNRLTAAEAAGLEEVPCLVIETDDVRRLVMEHLMAKRKGSTGQRIMAFLETHRREVLKVAEIVGDGTGNSVGVKRARALANHVSVQEIPKHLEIFTAQAIAVQLRVSPQDVGLGIELLQCIEKKLRATDIRGTMVFRGRPLDMENPRDCAYHSTLLKTRDRLFMGASPIRRWKAAIGGLDRDDPDVRPDVNHAELARKAMATMRNAFRNWSKIPGDSRQALAILWVDVLKDARKVNLD